MPAEAEKAASSRGVRLTAAQKAKNKRANHIRNWVRAIHRDVGYFLAPLIVIYSISGIAVNHIDDWNPSYSTTIEPRTFAPVSPAGTDPFESHSLEQLEALVQSQFQLAPSEIQGHRRLSPTDFVVYLEHGGEAKLNLVTGLGSLKRIAVRQVLFQSNVLHLNHLKGVWTYVADLFGVLLAGLALSGIVMLKGEKGFWGRGKWFVLAGTLVPVLGLLSYYASR